jgi:hypothetical protein
VMREKLEEEPPARTLYVPEDLVIATWRALRPTAECGCEGVVFWAGPAVWYEASAQVATTVIAPEQGVSPGRFDLTTAAVRAMGRAVRERNLVNLAQVHTHPEAWVGHSPWDDAHAFSLRSGALSIVWPKYGQQLPAFGTWGVHERTADEWVHLEGRRAARRITILPGLVELRARLEFLDFGTEELDA